MFKPSSNRCNTRSQKTLNILLQKKNIGQQALFLLGPKIWIKIGFSTKIVKITASFTLSLKRKC